MHSSFVSGFTEFVPLSFIAAEAPMYKKSLVPGIAASMPDEEVLRIYAVSRLMLDPWIANIQASWVKQGPRLAQRCLQAGANDFGGTLMNEGISTSAGAPHGQCLHSAEMRKWIRMPGGLLSSARPRTELCAVSSRSRRKRSPAGSMTALAPTGS